MSIEIIFERPPEDAFINRYESTDLINAFLISLTPKQLSAVAAIVSGMTQVEIAEAYGLSRDRVDKRLKEVEKKAKAIFGNQAVENRKRSDHHRSTKIIE